MVLCDPYPLPYGVHRRSQALNLPVESGWLAPSTTTSIWRTASSWTHPGYNPTGGWYVSTVVSVQTPQRGSLLRTLCDWLAHAWPYACPYATVKPHALQHHTTFNAWSRWACAVVLVRVGEPALAGDVTSQLQPCMFQLPPPPPATPFSAHLVQALKSAQEALFGGGQAPLLSPLRRLDTMGVSVGLCVPRLVLDYSAAHKWRWELPCTHLGKQDNPPRCLLDHVLVLLCTRFLPLPPPFPHPHTY